MPKSSKPRKAYRPRPVFNPLNIRDDWKIEGDAHAVLLALESGQVDDVHMAMLAAHADMVRRIYPTDTPARRQADTVMRIVRDIKARHEITVLALEEVAIRAALQVTIPAVRSASNGKVYRAAVASMQDMDRLGGAVRVTL